MNPSASNPPVTRWSTAQVLLIRGACLQIRTMTRAAYFKLLAEGVQGTILERFYEN